MLALLFFLVNLIGIQWFSRHNQQLVELLSDPQSVSGQYLLMEQTFLNFFGLVLVALVKTALAEEILFRGFIAKRLMAWLGFQWGNLIQALLFGLLHLVLFLTITQNPGLLTWVFLSPAIMAWVVGYLNERMAGGSIWPGWAAHAAGNLATYLYFALA